MLERGHLRDVSIVGATLIPLVLAGCQSTAGNGGSTASVASLTAGGGFQTISAPAAQRNADYRIGAADVIDITVFQIPELSSQSLKVSGDGTIALPLAGVIKAEGLTTDQLAGQIKSRLGRYVQSPQVSVSVGQSLSRVYTVEGEVNQPGSFPISAGRSLMEAIASAGGCNSVGDPAKITVFRVKDGRKYTAAYDVDAIRNGSAADPQIVSGDVIVVGASTVRSALQFVLPPATSVGGVGASVGERIAK